jgi:hypothetical protein
MGLTSPGTLFGDIVSIFSGAKTPFTLRIDNNVRKVPSVYTSLARYIFMALRIVKNFPLVEPKQLSCGRRHQVLIKSEAGATGIVNAQVLYIEKA